MLTTMTLMKPMMGRKIIKKIAGVFSLSVVLALANISPSIAAIKVGSACKKAGITTLDSGKKYTCIKQGKKFVWSKGVVVKVNPPNLPSPSPTPTIAPAVSPTPTPSFIEPVRAKSFSDLIENSDGLTYWAWKLTQERMGNSGNANVEFIIDVGPNTKLNFINPEKAFQDVANFYSSFEQVAKYHAVFFDYKDLQWAIDLDQKNSLNPRPSEILKSCLIQSQCNGGNAYIDNKLTGFTYIASSPIFSNEKIRKMGIIEAHEYFHTIQFLPSIKSQQKGQSVAWMPDWIREGSAQWLSTSMYFKDFEELMNYQRTDSENDLYRNKFTANDVENVLTANSASNNNGWLAYNVGAKAMEALVVLKGVDVALDFYVEGSKGIAFETTFENIFGISWAKAKPILATAISKKYK